MAITYKDMVAAANAVVPPINATDAAKLVDTGGAVLVDVRDGTELQASGKAKGALAIPRARHRRLQIRFALRGTRNSRCRIVQPLRTGR